MNAIEYLYSYSNMRFEITLLKGKIEALESSLDAVTGFHDVHVQKSKDPYRREKLLAELADLRADLYARVDELELQGLEVLNVIASLENPMLSKVLMLEYVQCLSPDEIRKKHNINPCDYRFEAIDELQRVLDEREAAQPALNMQSGMKCFISTKSL